MSQPITKCLPSVQSNEPVFHLCMLIIIIPKQKYKLRWVASQKTSQNTTKSHENKDKQQVDGRIQWMRERKRRQKANKSKRSVVSFPSVVSPTSPSILWLILLSSLKSSLYTTFLYFFFFLIFFESISEEVDDSSPPSWPTLAFVRFQRKI